MVLFLHHKEENERALTDLYQIVLRQTEATLLKPEGTVLHLRTAFGLWKSSILKKPTNNKKNLLYFFSLTLS